MWRSGLPFKILLVMIMFALLATSGPGYLGTTAAQEMSHLDKITKNGEITVALYLSNPPWASRNDKGEPIGYEVDLANQLAADLGVKLNIVETTNESRIPLLVANKVDAVIACFTRTLERAKSIDFTDPLVLSGSSILARKGTGIKGMSDLNGKTVVYEHGSTAETLVQKFAPQANSLKVTTKQDMLLSLREGKADATIQDSVQAEYMASQAPDLYEIVGAPVSTEYICIGLPKGDQNWLNWMNLWVFSLQSSGMNHDLFVKWFTAEPLKLTPSW